MIQPGKNADNHPTPLIATLCEDVAEVCGRMTPQATARLIEGLHSLLYKPFRDFDRLTADSLNALVWRLASAEAALSPRNRTYRDRYPSWEEPTAPPPPQRDEPRPRSDARYRPSAAESSHPVAPSPLIEAMLDLVHEVYQPGGLTRRMTLRDRWLAKLARPFSSPGPLTSAPLADLAERVRGLETATLNREIAPDGPKRRPL